MAAVEADRLPKFLAILDVFYPMALVLAVASRHYWTARRLIGVGQS
jgi:hypothetical protein